MLSPAASQSASQPAALLPLTPATPSIPLLSSDIPPQRLPTHPVAVTRVLAGVGVVGAHLAAHEELIKHGHQVAVLADDVVHQAAEQAGRGMRRVSRGQGEQGAAGAAVPQKQAATQKARRQKEGRHGSKTPRKKATQQGSKGQHPAPTHLTSSCLAIRTARQQESKNRQGRGGTHRPSQPAISPATGHPPT